MTDQRGLAFLNVERIAGESVALAIDPDAVDLWGLPGSVGKPEELDQTGDVAWDACIERLSIEGGADADDPDGFRGGEVDHLEKRIRSSGSRPK